MTALREALLGVPVPGEEAASERARAVVAEAFAERAGAERGARRGPEADRRSALRGRRRATPLAGRRRGTPLAGRRRATPLAVAAAAALTAGAALAAVPGTAVHRWIASIVDPGPAVPLERLPTAGRMLVIEHGTATRIDADGTRHDLGPYGDVTWSPHGLFVGAADGSRLVAMEPDGDVRWARSAGAPVADPRWGPDGYRVAYRAGEGLRVVAGDGSGDHLVALRVAPVAPAWRPDATHVLAYATARGVRVVQADAALPIGHRVHGLPRHARWVEWAGPRLLAASGRRLAAVAPRGTATWSAPRGARILTAAVAPDAQTVAVLLRRARLSRVVLLGTGALRLRRTLATVAAPLRDLVWAPDGRWLASAPAGGGRWLLLPLARNARPRALRGAALPRAWCCAP